MASAMSALVVLAGVAAGAFVSTNLDAFVVLVANVTRAPTSRRAAMMGFLAATAIVLAGSWAFASAARVLPPAKTGFAGVVPLGMGLNHAFKILRRRLARARAAAQGREDLIPPSSTPQRDSVGFREALALHMSLSLDNFAVYTALLADTLPHLRVVVSATVVGLGAAWTALALATARLPGLAQVMLRWGRAVMAVLLIGVGIYILSDTDTDVLLPGAGVSLKDTGPGSKDAEPRP
jgi:cadmium resistance protein CadD (predicted permease)